MTLATDEFIRRFLIHVLPKGFHRIRHYGLFASADRAANIARARELLAVPPPKAEADTPRRQRRPNRRRHCAAMPVLRRPHDHHRDLRARLPRRATGRQPAARDQDRHVMIASHDAENAATLLQFPLA